jgi:trimethylamine--corrinoid protein Co-methyltransferase
MLHVLHAGIDMSANGQALDAVWEVGPGRHYLGSAHTRRNFHDAFYRSLLASSETFEQWHAEGGLDMARRANRAWKEMLDAYEAPPLDPATSEALRTFVAERKASMPDAFV